MFNVANYRNQVPSFVGFDSIFDQLDSIFEGTKEVSKNLAKTWPPYNVVKTGDRTYKVEIAVAGVSKNDINIEMAGNVLKISGESKPDENATYLHKGIAERSFTRSFTLADSIEVKNAEMVNGMLEIWLENTAKAMDVVKKISIK